MALSFISGVAEGFGDSVTLGTHASGDIIIICAWRENNATAPSLPSGFTNIVDGGNSDISSRIGYKIATSSSEGSGTWTNATGLVALVHRGQHASPIGANSTANGSGTTLTYPALTLGVGDGTSWVIAFGGHKWGGAATLDTPSGMTSRASDTGGQMTPAGFDTNGGVSSWSSTDADLSGGGFDDWQTRMIELKEGAAAGGQPTHRRWRNVKHMGGLVLPMAGLVVPMAGIVIPKGRLKAA